MDLHAQIFNLLPQNCTTRLIHLQTHQPGHKFHNMGTQSHIFQSICTFQPQESATNHHAGLAIFGICRHRIKIIDRAIDKVSRLIVAFNRRHKGIGAGRENQLVVGQH